MQKYSNRCKNNTECCKIQKYYIPADCLCQLPFIHVLLPQLTISSDYSLLPTSTAYKSPQLILSLYSQEWKLNSFLALPTSSFEWWPNDVISFGSLQCLSIIYRQYILHKRVLCGNISRFKGQVLWWSSLEVVEFYIGRVFWASL